MLSRVAGTLFAGVLLAGAAGLPAQTVHAPDGGAFERITSIEVPEKPGAPFTATVATSWKRRLEDGTEVTVYNRRTIARDSTGRVYQERHFFSPNGNVQPTRISSMEYYDPSRNEMTQCTLLERRCIVRSWHMNVGEVAALPASVNAPNGFKITRESLGERTIEDLQVSGSREISTTPRLGDAEPTIKEFWYSPRLGINLVVKRFEPRGGAEDFSVEQISLTEPDARLLQPPADFQMVELPKTLGQSVGSRPMGLPER